MLHCRTTLPAIVTGPSPELIQPSPFQIGGVNLPYVVYRVVVATYFCVMTVYSFFTFNSQAKWIVYMTHWSYSVITVNSVLQAVAVKRHYDNCKRHGSDNG